MPTPAAAVTQPVTFSGPGGTAILSPDPATLADTRDPGDARRVYSTRSAIVTGLIAAGQQNGQYTVGAVPGIIDPADSGTAAGWSLIVVYGNPLIGTLRDVELFVGSSAVGAGQSGPVVQISGFKVPTAGAVNAHISISTLEGDPNKTGDQFRFLGGTAPIPALTAANALSGPNNQVNNFFASQINYGNPPDPGLAAAPSGTLDPLGTFGAFNSPVGSIATARRQGWDVTNVDASAQLKNGDTNAAFQGTTAGDAYVITVTGVQIDVFQPTLQISKTSNGPWIPGQTVPAPTYNINVTNAGSAPTVGTSTVLDQLPAGITANTAAPPFSTPELGWSCTASPTQLLTCSHAAAISNVVNANTANFTVPILVGAASGNVVNYASVGGGGDPFNGGAPPAPGAACTDTAHCANVPTEVQSRSAALIKSVRLSTDADGNGVPTPGDTLTYTVAFANDGTAPLPAAQITDTIPANTTIVAGSATVVSTLGAAPVPAANAAFNGTTNTALLAAAASTIAPAGNIVVAFRVTINAGFHGMLDNRATATAAGLVPPLQSSTADNSTTGLPPGITIPPGSLPQGPNFTPNTGPPIAGPTVVNVVTPGLSVLKSVLLSTDADGNGVPSPGDTLTWTVFYANTGDAPLPAAQIADSLPAGTTIVAGSAAIASASNTTPAPAANTAFDGSANRNLIANTVTVAPGGVIAATFRVTINAGFSGTLSNRATGTGTGLPPAGVLSSAIDNTTTGVPTGVVVPPGSVPQGPGGTPNTGGPINRTTDVIVTPPTAFGIKSVKLTTDADGNGVLTPGDTLTWTVAYKNSSTVPITAAQITDPLPTNTTIVAGSATIVNETGIAPAPTANAAYDGAANKTLLARPVTIAPSGIITVSFRTTLNAGDTAPSTNRAVLNGNGLPAAGIPTNAADNATTQIPAGLIVTPGSLPQGPGGAPNSGPPLDQPTIATPAKVALAGVKSVQLTTDADGNGVLTPGDTLTWTITYANEGGVAVSNAQITDGPLDAKTTLVPGSATIVAATGISPAPAPNKSFDGNAAKGLLLAPVTIAPRGVITVSFRVTLNAGATGPVLNRATLTGSGLPAAGIPTNAADNGTKGLPPGITVPPGSLPQGPSGQPNTGSPLNAPAFATPATVAAEGIKSVAVTGGPPATPGSHGAAPGNVLTWTIQYGNTGTAPIANAQITDTLPLHTTFVPGSVAIVSSHGVTPAPAANAAYNGAAAKNFLAAPVTLAPGSLIVVSFAVTIDPGFAGTIANRAALSGGGLPAGGIVTDAADDSTTALPPTAVVPPASVPQGPNGQPNSGPPLNAPTNVTSTAPNLSPLQVQKSVDREVAASGDRLIYTIVANNPNAIALGATTILDVMPGGVAYANGSTRIDGVPFKDPLKAGSTLSWLLPATVAKGQHRVIFAAVIAPGIPVGTIMTNTANANAKVPGTNTTLASPNAQAQTRVIGGIFNDCVTILGRVFVDKDNTGRFSRDDVGIPNVRIFLESGEYVVTDRYGKYNFACVRPGMHVLRLDTLTLPPGTAPYNVRNYDDPRSVQRLAHGVLDAGLIQNINFAIRGAP